MLEVSPLPRERLKISDVKRVDNVIVGDRFVW